MQLKLDENRHLVSPPKEIVAMGSAHVLRFLSKLYQGHERLYRMKLMYTFITRVSCVWECVCACVCVRACVCVLTRPCWCWQVRWPRKRRVIASISLQHAPCVSLRLTMIINLLGQQENDAGEVPRQSGQGRGTEGEVNATHPTHILSPLTPGLTVTATAG
jgi:hypothetical protein